MWMADLTAPLTRVGSMVRNTSCALAGATVVLKWLARRFLGHVEAEFFTRVENDGKVQLQPTDRLKAYAGGLVQAAMSSVKAPKGAPGALELPEGASLGVALGPVIGGFLKPHLPGPAKPYAASIGAVLADKLGPLLEGFMGSSGASPPAGRAFGGGKESPNPFLKRPG